MAFEQKVGEGWKCDGCGRLGRWDPEWSVYGTHFEQDEGVLRWVACSDACKRLIPAELKQLETHVTWDHGLSFQARDRIEELRAQAGWRAREAAKTAPRAPEGGR